MIKCSINYNINIKKVILNILIVFAMLTLFRLITVYELGKEEIRTYTIIVNDKDTLWNIASDISKDNNIDIQKVIYDIKEVNSIKSSNIYKGQTLLIPIYN